MIELENVKQWQENFFKEDFFLIFWQEKNAIL